MVPTINGKSAGSLDAQLLSCKSDLAEGNLFMERVKVYLVAVRVVSEWPSSRVGEQRLEFYPFRISTSTLSKTFSLYIGNARGLIWGNRCLTTFFWSSTKCGWKT